jgi:hypothetical protein
MVRVVEGDMVTLPPVVRFRWTPPESYDHVIVAGGILRTSQVNSALPPTATVMEGRGVPNSGWPEKKINSRHSLRRITEIQQ